MPDAAEHLVGEVVFWWKVEEGLSLFTILLIHSFEFWFEQF